MCSDAQVLGRTHRAGHKKGTELTLQMPKGEPLVAIVTKLDASSATEWCALARGEYSARKEEQKTKKVQSDVYAPTEAEPRTNAGRVPTLKETMDALPLNREALLGRVNQIRDWFALTEAEGIVLVKELRQIERILEVLDAPEDDGETVQSVHDVPGEGNAEGVGEEARPSQIYERGTDYPIEPSEGEALDLASPDTDAEGGSVDHDDKPTVPVGSGS